VLGNRHKTDGIATDYWPPGPLARLRHRSFEIGTGCNLATEYADCPILQPDRWPDTALGPLTVEDILRTVDVAAALGFRGSDGFHYYNEPPLSEDLFSRGHRPVVA